MPQVKKQMNTGSENVTWSAVQSQKAVTAYFSSDRRCLSALRRCTGVWPHLM